MSEALKKAVTQLPEKKKESKSSLGLAQKLLLIQNELKVPKNQLNKFGGYNYRSCEDILNAVKPKLAEQNLVLTITDELMNIGERYYIQATARLYSPEDDTQLEVLGYAREEETRKGMSGDQLTGASSSYARKYALNGLFLIDDSKDSDATNQGAKPVSNQAPKPAPPKAQPKADIPKEETVQAKLKALILTQIPKADLPEKRAEMAKAILKDVSTFTGKDGKPVFYSRDIKDMPEKWAATAYGTLKKRIEEAEKSQAKVEGKPMSREEVEQALSSDAEVDAALGTDEDDPPFPDEEGDRVPF